MFRLSLKVWLNNRRCLDNKYLDVVYVSNRWRHDKTVLDSANADFLVRLLGVEQSTALTHLRNHKPFKRIPHSRITEAYEICVKHGLDKTTLSADPYILILRPYALEQRISLLKDLGYPKILPHMIKTFYSMMNLTVKDLKEQKLLPADADVTKNLLNCLHEPPPHVPSIRSLPDDHTASAIHFQVLSHYLLWKLDLTREHLNRIMFSRVRLKHQSLSILKRTFDVLENDFGLPKKKIGRNHFLLSRDPSNTERMLKEIKYIGTLDTKSMLLKYPRLLHVKVEMMQEKLKVLKEFGINDNCVSTSPDVLTLSCKNIAKRLQELETHPELKAHRTNPRFLALLIHFPSVLRRMEILKNLNVRCASLHILSTSQTLFKRYILVGTDRTKGIDLVKFLSYELEVDSKSIQASLKRHPLWCQIPFLHVQETFTFLKENNYSNQDILNNIQIVIYRRALVEKELHNIDCGRYDESWDFTPSKKLALCLYNMEKAYHFSGNGVWNCHEDEEEQNSQSLRHTSNL